MMKELKTLSDKTGEQICNLAASSFPTNQIVPAEQLISMVNQYMMVFISQLTNKAIQTNANFLERYKEIRN